MTCCGGKTVAWTRDMAVGVDVIDAQHRDLFDGVNALLEAAVRGRAREEVARLMLFLEDYIANHFGTEEIYMRRFQYPAYSAHKAEHVAFIGDFIDLREELDAHGPTVDLIERLCRRVCGWLTAHIGRTDRAFGLFMREALARGQGGDRGDA